MRWRRRLVTSAVAALTAAGLAGGALLGLRLGAAASAPTYRTVAIAAPDGFAGPAATARRSPGGFTGFGGRPALAGDVLRSGTVETTGSDIVITSTESTITVRPSSAERLFAIGPATAPLRAGDTVQLYVRDGVVLAVLRLPPGIGQGGNR